MGDGEKSKFRVHRLASVQLDDKPIDEQIEVAKAKKIAQLDNYVFAGALFVLQAGIMIGVGEFTYANTDANFNAETHPVHPMYGYFRDVNIMIFFGFGFLMTFLHRHGLSAIGYCLVLSAITVECSLIAEYSMMEGIHKQRINGRYPLSIESCLNGLFCAAAVMISYGAVIGKVSPCQLLVMTVVEVWCFWANFRTCITELEAHDVGGGMTIHTFGAYFGLAAAWVVTTYTPGSVHNDEEKSIYTSDIFSLAGTVFLWVLWPSFQSAVAGDEQRQLIAIIQTFLSLCSSTMAFAVFSRLINNNKFDVVHMQNATLAGGVAMGVAGDMDLGVYGAMLGGFSAGMVSCLGYTYIMHTIADKFNIHDTCGVNNLHGMPGIVSGIIGCIACAMHDNEPNPNDAAEMAAARAGGHRFNFGGFYGVDGTDQVAALFTTLGISIGGGLIAGVLMTVPMKMLGLAPLPSTELFNDRLYFGMAADYQKASATEATKELVARDRALSDSVARVAEDKSSGAAEEAAA